MSLLEPPVSFFASFQPLWFISLDLLQLDQFEKIDRNAQGGGLYAVLGCVIFYKREEPFKFP